MICESCVCVQFLPPVPGHIVPPLCSNADRSGGLFDVLVGLITNGGLPILQKHVGITLYFLTIYSTKPF